VKIARLDPILPAEFKFNADGVCGIVRVKIVVPQGIFETLKRSFVDNGVAALLIKHGELKELSRESSSRKRTGKRRFWEDSFFAEALSIHRRQSQSEAANAWDVVQDGRSPARTASGQRFSQNRKNSSPS